MQGSKIRVREITGFGITTADAARLIEFYLCAFGAELLSSERVAGAQFELLMGVRGGAQCHHLQLGEERLDILQFDTLGKPYPRMSSPYQPVFQHFAIVVSDMASAMSHLQGVRGWLPLSSGGPQQLPQRSGGVTAFKFQDPDGHPLELLAFPADAIPAHWQRLNHALFLGIDHSAISVRDTAVSCEFYRALGFAVTGETYNHGIEQALLDGMPSPQLVVTALSASVSTPHLELLCYRSDANRPPQVLANNDVAATRTHLAADPVNGKGRIAGERLITDPDGHHLHFVSRPLN